MNPLELTIPGLTSINSAAAKHWTRRHAERKQWKNAVVAAVLETLGRFPTPLAKAKVTITRCSSAQPDFDNLANGAKFLLDGLILAGVIADDGPDVIGQPVMLWEFAPRGAGCVRIKVESVDEQSLVV